MSTNLYNYSLKVYILRNLQVFSFIEKGHGMLNFALISDKIQKESSFRSELAKMILA
jgi:hypothetical protein